MIANVPAVEERMRRRLRVLLERQGTVTRVAYEP